MSRCLVLFSGGTDSSVTAALMAKQYDHVELVTYDRFGIFDVDNSRLNADLLKDRFGEDKFTHKIIDFDKVFKKISYQNYLKNVMKHGFMNLSTCGLCKLSMHLMTLVYCLEYNIKHVYDGANKGMEIFPAQMDSVLNELKKMYAQFEITYENPVFDYEPPENKGLIKDENMAILKTKFEKEKKEQEEIKGQTTGDLLHEMKLAPEKNIKGTRYDQRRQPRCFQFMLFSTYVNKWYLPKKDMKSYRDDTLSFFKDKIKESTELVNEFRKGNYQDIFEFKER